MAQQHTKLSDKDFKLLKKEGVSVLGENGPLHPTFGNDVQDFVKFHVYDLNDTYLKSGKAPAVYELAGLDEKGIKEKILKSKS